MAIPSKHLDDAIAMALASEAVVTQAQRQAAWASVCARAARQIMLPPRTCAAARSPSASLAACLLTALRWGLFLLSDSPPPYYDRAAVRREALQRAAARANRCPAFTSYLIHCYHPSMLLRVGLF
ncbi:MAG: hypothetical protein ACUVSX_04575 [Aggregatilineales bacterium]